MEGLYKVNLIPNDLCMEESILQIADALDNLNGIVDDVFARVTLKIKLNMDKTNNLKKRIEASRAKVEKLTGMQKAIKVFSSAKYPSAINHCHYKSAFDLNCYQHEPRKVALTGNSRRQPNEKKIQEKLHFYHVKVADTKELGLKPDPDVRSVLTEATTIGDLLIFNTEETPYVRSKGKQAYVPKVVTSVDNKVALDDAPPSIVKRNVLKREADEYMYAPGMGLVPELDMPLDLPHLPGIAGDVQFSFTADRGSIAPSVVASPVVPNPDALEVPDVPDLPDIPDLDPTDLPDVGEPERAPLPDLTDAPPPPPPPPQVQMAP